MSSIYHFQNGERSYPLAVRAWEEDLRDGLLFWRLRRVV